MFHHKGNKATRNIRRKPTTEAESEAGSEYERVPLIQIHDEECVKADRLWNRGLRR